MPSNIAGVLPQGLTRTALLLALLLIPIAPRISSAAGVRENRPNLVGGEVLGRGFVLTVNYERFLTNHFGLGAGFMMIGTSDGLVGVVPLYASYLTGDKHSLYLGAGAAFLSEGGSVNDYESTWVLQGSIGYHFQSPSGFFVRPLFTFNQEAGGGDFLLWPGVTIGGSF
jgi:hypothetical protein